MISGELSHIPIEMLTGSVIVAAGAMIKRSKLTLPLKTCFPSRPMAPKSKPWLNPDPKSNLETWIRSQNGD